MISMRTHCRKCVYRLCNRLGIKLSSVSKQSKHLDYSHPMMESVRSFVAASSTKYNVDQRLIGNFDQVWTMNYEGPRRVLYKHQSKRSQIIENVDMKPSAAKMLASIRKALSLDSVDDEPKKKEVCQPVSLNAAGNLNPVENARIPRTTTTLSWADGWLGRSYVTLHPGTVYTA